MRRGIEAPDLHPEAIFPGSFLPHRGSLPWFWSWIRPFPPSPHGCTTQPRAGPLLSGEQKSRAEPSTHKGSSAAAQVPSCQAWLPGSQLPGRAIELEARNSPTSVRPRSGLIRPGAEASGAAEEKAKWLRGQTAPGLQATGDYLSNRARKPGKASPSWAPSPRPADSTSSPTQPLTRLADRNKMD